MCVRACGRARGLFIGGKGRKGATNQLRRRGRANGLRGTAATLTTNNSARANANARALPSPLRCLLPVTTATATALPYRPTTNRPTDRARSPAVTVRPRSLGPLSLSLSLCSSAQSAPRRPFSALNRRPSRPFPHCTGPCDGDGVDSRRGGFLPVPKLRVHAFRVPFLFPPTCGTSGTCTRHSHSIDRAFPFPPTTNRKEVPAAAAAAATEREKEGVARRRKNRTAVCAHDITATIHRRAERERERERETGREGDGESERTNEGGVVGSGGSSV